MKATDEAMEDRSISTASSAESSAGGRSLERDRANADRRTGPVCLRALVVDSTGPARDTAEKSLAEAGFEVRVCGDALEAFAVFLRELPDVLVLAAESTDLQRSALLERMRGSSDVPVVVYGGASDSGAQDDGPLDGAPLGRGVDDLVARTIDAVTAHGVGSRRRHRLTADRVRMAARSALRTELERQLVACRGNLAEIARRMGKDRSTIRYHLRRFGMLFEEGARP